MGMIESNILLIRLVQNKPHTLFLFLLLSSKILVFGLDDIIDEKDSLNLIMEMLIMLPQSAETYTFSRLNGKIKIFSIYHSKFL